MEPPTSHADVTSTAALTSGLAGVGLMSDHETKDMIDKFARFVAKNGPEFENMTKQKQVDNQRFAFLYGGPLFSYYQAKLESEREKISKEQLPSSSYSRHPTDCVDDMLPTPSMHMGPPYHRPPPLGLLYTRSNQLPTPFDHANTYHAPMPPYWPPQSGAMSIPPLPQLAGPYPIQRRHPPPPTPPHQKLMKPPPPNLLLHLLRDRNDAHEIAVRQVTCLMSRISRLGQEAGINLDQLDRLFFQAMEACTKEKIANARNMILNELMRDENCVKLTIATFLEKLIVDLPPLGNRESAQRRLHVVYLLNDVLFHVSRNASDEEGGTKTFKCRLLRALPILFACACARSEYDSRLTDSEEDGDIDRRSKLIKLLDLWQKNNYFREEHMLKELADKIGVFGGDSRSPEVEELARRFSSRICNFFDSEFADEQNMIKAHEIHHYLEPSIHHQQYHGERAAMMHPVGRPYTMDPRYDRSYSGGSSAYEPYPSMNQPPRRFPMPFDPSQPPPTFPPVPPFSGGLGPLPRYPPPRAPVEGNDPYYYHHNGQMGEYPYHNPAGRHGGGQIPLLPLPPGCHPMTAPLGQPLGLPPIDPYLHETDRHRSIPYEEPMYYDLPAGIMCLVVDKNDFDYDPLDPDEIRPVTPPNEDDMQEMQSALDKFYDAKEIEETADGWSANGLVVFYKAKMKAKEDIKKQQIAESEAKTVSEKLLEKTVEDHRSEEGEEEEEEEEEKETVSFSSRSRSDSSVSGSCSSSSPESSCEGEKDTKKDESYRSTKTKNRRRKNLKRGGVKKTASGSDSDGKLTTKPIAAEPIASLRPLDPSNKGHQLLQKMGWSGSGLGKKEQGIVEPISGGEVREHGEKYKGVGSSADPFDQFRKARSQQYSKSWTDRR